MQALVVYLVKVRVPMAAVIAIYARENGAGMMFEPEPAYEEGYTPSLVMTNSKTVIQLRPRRTVSER